MASRYEQMLAQVQQAIDNYERAPGAFSDEDVRALKDAAAAVGINFEPQFSMGRAIKKGVFEMADTALLGLLPNEWSPEALTGAEETAGTIGGLLGYAVPGAAAMKLGSATVRGGQKAAQFMGRGGFRIGEGGSAVAEALRGRISQLQQAAASVKNPRLKKFYEDALLKTYSAIGSIDKVVGPAMMKGVRGAVTVAARYPRATKYGIGVPAFLGMADLFEASPEEYPNEMEQYY